MIGSGRLVSYAEISSSNSWSEYRDLTSGLYPGWWRYNGLICCVSSLTCIQAAVDAHRSFRKWLKNESLGLCRGRDPTQAYVRLPQLGSYHGLVTKERRSRGAGRGNWKNWKLLLCMGSSLSCRSRRHERKEASASSASSACRVRSASQTNQKLRLITTYINVSWGGNRKTHPWYVDFLF